VLEQQTLRTDTLALIHSTAEYCTPAWSHSAHIRYIDPVINDALRTVTGCIRPADNLSILAGIQPVEIRRKGATLSLACVADDCIGLELLRQAQAKDGNSAH